MVSNRARGGCLSIEDFRAYNNSRLPRWYHWKLHIVLNVLVLSAGLYFPIWIIEEFNPVSIILLSLFFFIWSVIEYGLHRFVLHGSAFSFLKFKVEHTIFHHGYFNFQSMSVEKPIDTNRVLLFPMDLISVMALSLVLSFGLSFVLGSTIAILFFLAGVLYSIAYETTHAICHWRVLEKFPVLEGLVKHHRTHHDPEIMSTKNFSVVLPFVDKWFGTASVKSSNEASRV